jgi:hypothetical protein
MRFRVKLSSRICWVRDVDRQCWAFGVPHFFKQAYVLERGVPCEKPLLDGKVVQEVPVSPKQRKLFEDA